MTLEKLFEELIFEYKTMLQVVLCITVEDINEYVDKDSLLVIKNLEQRLLLDEKRKALLACNLAFGETKKSREFYREKREEMDGALEEAKKNHQLQLDRQFGNILANYTFYSDRLLDPPTDKRTGIEAYRFAQGFPKTLAMFIKFPMKRYQIIEKTEKGSLNLMYDMSLNIDEILRQFFGECTASSGDYHIYIQEVNIEPLKKQLKAQLGMEILLKEDGEQRFK